MEGYLQYDLISKISKKIKCKRSPRECSVSESPYYMELDLDKRYELSNDKLFSFKRGEYELLSINAEKKDYNEAILGDKDTKIHFLKKYPSSVYKKNVEKSFIESFNHYDDTLKYMKSNKEFVDKLDERAFQLAKSTRSSLKYQEYIDTFPAGIYVKAAKEEIIKNEAEEELFVEAKIRQEQELAKQKEEIARQAEIERKRQEEERLRKEEEAN